MFRDVRRIVTGHNAAGKSCLWKVGPAAEVVDLPGMRLSEIWRTESAPARVDGEEDMGARGGGLEPGEQGSHVVFFEVAPRGTARTGNAEAANRDAFERIGAAETRGNTARHPGMHRTRTIDYVILLDGEITLILEEEEITLKPFDMVVQRGTDHAWENRGDRPALLAGVLIGATLPEAAA